MGKSKSLMVILIGLVFVALGSFLLARGETADDRAMGLFVVLFFGAGALIGISDLIPARLPPLIDEVVVIRPSRVRAAIFVIGGLAFAIGGVMMAHEILVSGVTLKLAIGALGLPFGLIVMAIAGRQMLSPRTLYEIDRDGVASLHGIKWSLAWSDISAIGIGSVRGNRWLVLETYEHVPDPVGRLSRLNRRFGMPPYAIAAGTSGVDFDALADQVYVLWQARANAPGMS